MSDLLPSKTKSHRDMSNGEVVNIFFSQASNAKVIKSFSIKMAPSYSFTPGDKACLKVMKIRSMHDGARPTIQPTISIM